MFHDRTGTGLDQGDCVMNGKQKSNDRSSGGRFKKGKSGNPKGRPLKRQVETSGSVFDLIVDQTLTITRDGVPREVSMDEALQHKTYQQAIAGNRTAVRQVLKMIEKREKARSARNKNIPIPSPKLLFTTDPRLCGHLSQRYDCCCQFP